MADITEAIAALTDRVIAVRVLKEKGLMPLEIKGLKGKALQARGNIERLNRAYDTFNAAAPKHAGDVEGLASQVAEMQGDLNFAADVLGNSTAQSDESGDTKPDGDKFPKPGAGNSAG